MLRQIGKRLREPFVVGSAWKAFVDIDGAAIAKFKEQEIRHLKNQLLTDKEMIFHQK